MRETSLLLDFKHSSDFGSGNGLNEASLSLPIKGFLAMDESLREKSVDNDEMSEDNVLSSSITFDGTSCSSFERRPEVML